MTLMSNQDLINFGNN